MRRIINVAKLLARLVFCSLLAVGSCWAIGEERFVEGEFHSGDFVLARAGGAAGARLKQFFSASTARPPTAGFFVSR
jgi:hypothetical protein